MKGQVLITKDQRCSEFWNTQCEVNSKKLWLPTKTDLQDLDWNSLDNLNLIQDSWFTVSAKSPKNKIWPKISLESSHFIAQECTGTDVTKSLKIKLYPTKIKTKKKLIDQRLILREWFGVSRQCFNYTIDLINAGYWDSFFNVRKAVMKTLNERYPWMKNTPYDVRANAIKDAYTSCKTARKMTNTTHKRHEVKHRTRKDQTQSIFIPRATVKQQGIYKRYLNKIKSSEPFDSAEHDSRLCYKRYIGFYLQLPQTAETPVDNQDKFGEVVALDPGVRTFQTAFSNQGIFEFGKKDVARINRMQYHISKMKGSRKRKAQARAYKRIKDLISDLHWKIAKFLAVNFRNIVIPVFKVQQMINRQNRTLHRKTVRGMLNWSHYTFRMRLIHQARKYGANVWVANEAYTSKTCTNCGVINTKLGGSKVFNCPSCRMIIDRDINGARNILLRALVDSPVC